MFAPPQPPTVSNPNHRRVGENLASFVMVNQRRRRRNTKRKYERRKSVLSIAHRGHGAYIAITFPRYRRAPHNVEGVTACRDVKMSKILIAAPPVIETGYLL